MQLTKFVAAAEDIVDQSNDRRATQTAGDDHNIAAARFFDRPGAAEGTTDADDVALLQAHQGLGDLADAADGVRQRGGLAGIAAHRDRGR